MTKPVSPSPSRDPQPEHRAATLRRVAEALARFIERRRAATPPGREPDRG